MLPLYQQGWLIEGVTLKRNYWYFVGSFLDLSSFFSRYVPNSVFYQIKFKFLLNWIWFFIESNSVFYWIKFKFSHNWSCFITGYNLDFHLITFNFFTELNLVFHHIDSRFSSYYRNKKTKNVEAKSQIWFVSKIVNRT